MNRRLLVIFASIIVVLGLFVGAYFLFFGNQPTLTPTDPTDLFGSSSDRTDSPALTPDGQPVQGAGTVVAPRLVRISDVPVAHGARALHIPATTSTTTEETLPSQEDTEVRFIERQSGNIYAFRFHDRVLTRISNRTIPGIQEATWSADGSYAFMRYLTRTAAGTEQIDTYALPVDGEGEGYFLSPNLSQVVLLAGDRILSLLPGVSGLTASVSSYGGTETDAFFSSPLAHLAVSPFGSELIAHTRASRDIDGYAFRVSAGGTFTRIIGPLRGLSALGNPAGTTAVFSYLSQNRLVLQARNLETREMIALPLATLTEKCVWSPSGTSLYCGVPTSLQGNLPDDWYQGAVSFTDRIWHINLETRLAELVVDPVQVADVAIDAVDLTIDPQRDVLVFTNKRDGTLWAYDL